MDLRQMAREEKNQVAAMMARGFFHDALWMTMIPTEDIRYQFLELFFLSQLERALKNGLVEVTHNLTGAMLWLFPPKKRKNMPYLDWHIMSAFLLLDTQSRRQVLDYLAFIRQMETKHQKPGTWQLINLVVEEDWQAQGIGRVLLRKQMRRLDNQASVAFTMTHSLMARSLFHKLGFLTITNCDLLIPHSQLYILERPPRVSTDIRI